MNILIVGKFYSEGFALHICETLIEMGHNLFRFEVGLRVSQPKGVFDHRMKMLAGVFYQLYSKSEIYANRRSANILEVYHSVQIDLTICCHDNLTPKEIDQIKKFNKSPIVLWFPDAISNFGKAMFLDAKYDMLFFKEPFAVRQIYAELGKECYYLPECCNPNVHKKISLSEDDIKKYGCDISTAGNLHTARSSLFKQLTQYDIRIWGAPAPRWMEYSSISSMVQNKFVSNEEKSKAFLAAKIVLNNIYPTEVSGVNVRTFEIAGCGGFQICSWRSGISQLFVEDEEIVCYRNIPELKSKIDYYLLNQNERITIAEKGFYRASVEHTYKSRLDLMLATIFNGSKGFVIQNQD